MHKVDHQGVDGAEALLFDLGGVVIDVDFDRVFTRWAADAGCDRSRIKDRFSFDEAFQRHEKGQISATEYFGHLRATLGIAISDDQFRDGWNSIFGGEMPGIAALLTEAASRFPLFAFSNTNKTHEGYFTGHFASVLGNFRNIYISSTMGMRKPDPEAFDFGIEAIGVPAERIVFFDDSPLNIDGAKARRMRAVRVTTSADVAAALATLGL